MTLRPEDGPDEPRLDSWKETASYLGAAGVSATTDIQ
jgi:hypothetical protein